MKCKKLFLRYFSTFFCVVMLFMQPCLSIGSHASITTPSGHPDFTQSESSSVLEDIDWRKLASTVFKLKGIISPSIVGTASGFIQYDLEHNNALTAHPTIGIRNNSDGTTTYDIDKELRQEIFNYINSTYVESAPLTYTVCNIHTYNMVNVQWFPTYQLYQTWKTWASQQNGYILTKAYIANGSTQGVRACVIPKTNDVNFVGTTTGGVFTNVAMYIGWSATNTPWTIANGAKWVEILNNGTIRDFNGAGQVASTLGNTTNINDSTTSRMTIWTNLPKDETVFVFNSLNALKAYNSGVPQDYYLRNDWSNTVDDNNLISSDELDRYGNSYSEVVNNIQTGMTGEQVIQLVDTILKNSSSGSGSSSSDKDNSKWWERIGNALGNLIDGLVDVITKVIEKLSDALLSIVHLLTGYTDDNGVYHDGLFDKLTDLVDSGFSSFISSMFSWLPDEIVTLLTATLVFGIFFGIFKMLRR